MKRFLGSCAVLLLLLSSCGDEQGADNASSQENIAISQTGSETEMGTGETILPEAVDQESQGEENNGDTELGDSQGEGEILDEETSEEIADISEDSSGGQFIFETETGSRIKIYPIESATVVIEWDDTTIYGDPSAPIEGFESPDFVYVTHEHEHQFSTGALESVLVEGTTFLTTQTVFEKLTPDLKGLATVINNGESIDTEDFTVSAIPAYNIRPEALEYHPKGIGNGYVFEKDGFRMYFSGDSEDTPEMRELKDIDIAFISMNLPFTMSIESAASAVLEFAPKKVFPYHYRGEGGLSDIEGFKKAVEAENPDIEVLLGDWYPE